MTLILDTSVILSAGKRAFYSFDGEEVVVPLVVVGELEKKRNDPELGLTARNALRFLEELRVKGDIKQGVKLENSSLVRIEINHVDTSGLPEGVRRDGGNDIRILAVAHSLGGTLISRDLPLRIKAEIAGVDARDLAVSDIPKDFVDSPRMLYVSDEEMSTFYDTGILRVENNLPRNSNVMLTTYSGSSTALAVSGASWKLDRVRSEQVCGIEGKNAMQRYALHHLLDKETPVVSLGGRAGSGKSLLALAAGMQQVKDGEYKKVVVFKTADPIRGGVSGALPGTESEKFSGFTASVFDAMEEFASRREVERMVDSGTLEILPVTHIRGRTLSGSFCIFDESQNAEYVTLVTMLTRIGKNSKIVLTHDISQIDSLHVSKHQGVNEVVAKLSGNKLFAHVELVKSERSDVAEMASTLLSDTLL